MPAYGPRLAETDIWNLIQFLDAQSAARNATAMTERVKPLLPIPAPDFSYERVGGPQETLVASRGDRVTLLVLFTLPQSMPRLADLATNFRAYANAGARVIAVPIGGEPAAAALSGVAGAESILATVGPDVAAAYTLFAQPVDMGGEGAAAHIEYLIDRQGQIRVRWMGVPDDASDRNAKALAQIGVLFREPPRPVPQWGHRH